MTNHNGDSPFGDAGYDDIIRKVRGSLHHAADRTPLGPGRVGEIVAVGNGVAARRRPHWSWLQVAASVAVVGLVAAVVALVHGWSGSHAGAVRTAGDGNALGAPPSSPTPTLTLTPTPTPASGGCTPENYYVIASPAQLEGLTYLLGQVPAGYQMYGAWGTISRNACPGSATWYAEYSAEGNELSLSATTAGNGPLQGELSRADGVAVTVAGHPGLLFGTEASSGGLVWRVGSVDLQLSGRLSAGALLALGNAVIPVRADDPRIVAPKDCQVPPGSACASSAPAETPTTSPMPSISFADGMLSSPLATPTPSG